MARLIDNELFERPSMRYMGYGVVALFLSVLHVTILRWVAVENITPDLLIILVVIIALREGQFSGTIAGFLAGLLLDVVSKDVLGTNAMSKTIAGFVAGYFYKEGFAREVIGNYRFVAIVAVSTFVHNLLYFFFYVKPMEVSFIGFFTKFGVATTLYTTVVAVFPMLYMNRRKEW